MASCNECRRSGWLLMVGSDGLCDSCGSTIRPLISSLCDNVLGSVKVAATSKNPRIVLLRLAAAADAATDLIPFQDRGLPTLTTPPKQYVATLRQWYSAEVAKIAATEVNSARSKSSMGVTDAAQLRPYTAAIDRLTTLSQDFPGVPEFPATATLLRSEMDSVRFRLFVRKADLAEAKGHIGKAIERLIEAMMALKHDSTEDAIQTSLAQEARSRIHELGGKAPY